MYPDLEPEARLARLLRELPDEAAQPYGFSEFQRRALQRAHAGRGRGFGQQMAAIVVIVAGLVALSLRFDRPAPLARLQPPANVQRAAPVPQPLAGGRQQGAVPEPETKAVAGRAEPARADLMERWLASLPREPALARVGNRAAVTGLEDRIAQVDDLLSVARASQAAPAGLMALQQERTRLVGALVQVRYAETLADASR